MRWHREDYVELMTFGRVQRPMFCELFGPLVGLEDEWRAQGATEDEIDLTAFDWDYVPVVRAPGHCGLLDPEPTRLVEETDEYLIQTTALGQRVKLCKGVATIALPLDYPVADMDDWLRLKPRFQWRDDRVNADAFDAVRAAQADGAMVVGHIPGGFDLPRKLMGEENACLAYYTQPELIADIMETLRQTALAVFERLCEHLTIDQLSVHEDLAGKSGPLIGPAQIEEFVRPYFLPVWECVSSHGTRMFEMDSDGDVTPVVEAFRRCGLTAMHPMEPAAGVDMVELRKAHGRGLAMKGGIDKHVLRRSQAEIRAELEYKCQPLMRQGGTVFALDHRIPNGTPLANYRYYVDTGREILGLPPRDPAARGWRRMAF